MTEIKYLTTASFFRSAWGENGDVGLVRAKKAYWKITRIANRIINLGAGCSWVACKVLAQHLAVKRQP